MHESADGTCVNSLRGEFESRDITGTAGDTGIIIKTGNYWEDGHANRTYHLAGYRRDCGLACWPNHEGLRIGLVGNIVVGIIGAIIAGWLLPRVGIIFIGGVVAEIINAVVGAVILLLIIGFVKKATWGLCFDPMTNLSNGDKRSLLAFLAHDATRLITGETFYVDAGYHIID